MISLCSADTPNAVPFRKIIDEFAKDCVAIKELAAGKKTFSKPTAVWTETSYSISLSGILDRLGKASNPPGPNPGGSSGWIYSGALADKKNGDSMWKIERSWTKGTAGVADSKLY